MMLALWYMLLVGMVVALTVAAEWVLQKMGWVPHGSFPHAINYAAPPPRTCRWGNNPMDRRQGDETLSTRRQRLETLATFYETESQQAFQAAFRASRPDATSVGRERQSDMSLMPKSLGARRTCCN
jgi:hypothetical protein